MTRLEQEIYLIRQELREFGEKFEKLQDELRSINRGWDSAGLPDSYKPASWRCTLPYDREAGGIGVAFNLVNGETVRLFLYRKSAEDLVSTISSYLGDQSQSATSSGKPSVEVSTPEDGENV